MTDANKVIEGLTILAKYYPDVLAGQLVADSEQIWYANYEPDKLFTDDLDRLKALDWFEEFGMWTFAINPDIRRD